MPSMGMGKTTRVFRARVLRSGRQLWIPSEGKRVRAIEGEQWIELEILDSVGDGNAAQCKESGWPKNSASLKQESSGIILNVDVNSTAVTPQLDTPEPVGVSENKNVDKMWGIVYRRKRKRAELENLCIADNGVNLSLENRRFGKQYVRKRFKKKLKRGSAESSQCHLVPVKHLIVVNSSHDRTNLISCLLNSILCYMRTTSVSLQQLFAFLHTKPIHDVYSSHGIHFLQECPSEMLLRACIISGVWFSLPVFSVNFSTVPCCFMYIHSSLFLRLASSSYVLWTFSIGVDERDIKMAVDTEHLLCDASESDHLGHKGVASNIDSGMWVLAQPIPRVPKVTVGNLPYDDSESDHFGQKKVSSNIDSGTWVLAQPVARVPKVTIGNLPLRNGCTIRKRRSKLRSRRVRFPSVIGMQKGNRMLVSNSSIFRHNGIPSSSLSSHYELRKKPPAVSSIPIPRISEVSGYIDSNYVPFIQPDSYISVKDDEATRALARKMANYDLDSDDEEWLNKFNNQSCSENKLHEPISAERLEVMIDAFERAAFSNPNGFADEKAASSICSGLERKEVVEAVYSYWSKKRKQKRSALISIFQLHQPKRTQVIPKSVIQKKRSFKRQKSQAGRGKQLTLLQAVEDAQQQQSAILKIKEAKSAAQKQECEAIVKRQTAQQLMENADLLTFKAMMALRLAEAAKIAEFADAAASLFHG